MYYIHLLTIKLTHFFMFYINQRYTNIRPGSYMAGFGKLNLLYHIPMHFIIFLSMISFFNSSFAKSNGVRVTAGSQVASVSGITAAAKDSAERIGPGVESTVSGVESAVSRVVSTVSGVVSAVSTLTTSARIAGNDVSRVPM